VTEVAPAGIVKSPEVDGVLDKVEEALDGADFYNEFIEGSVIDSRRDSRSHGFAERDRAGL
jgi:hypothetical protein